MATVSDHKTLDCPLCFETFTTPRILPCSHTFCEKCLISNFESQQQEGSKFLCQFCTTPISPAYPKIAIDKWVSDFPLNTLICSILESTDGTDKSDAENYCDPCKADGETNKAEVFCKDCQEKICSLCRKLHNRNKLLKHHTTVHIEELDQHLQCNINFDQECGHHREKIKLYCIDHRELCCAVCVAIDHRQCDDIRCIKDIAFDQSQRLTTDYPSIIRDIEKLKKEMQKILSKKKNNAKQVLEKRDHIIHDMDNRIDRIMDHMMKLKNTFKREMGQLYKDTESSMLTNEKIVENFIKNIENFLKILVIAKRNGTPQQKFITFENIRHQISSHYNQQKSKFLECDAVCFNINANKVLNDLEETINSVGTIEVSIDSSTATRDVLLNTDSILKNLVSRTKLGTEMCAAQVQKKDLMTSLVIFVTALTRNELGRGTFLTGGTYIGHHRLLMADYGANNNRLVELDDGYNIVKEYKIDGKPTDVAAGNKDNEIYIAVTLVSGKYIHKCTLHNDLTIVSRIQAPMDTWGIAVGGDNIIVGTPGAVVILTQDGSTVRSIPRSGGSCYVAVSKTQRTMYHSDNHEVVCRTLEGQEKLRFQNLKLKTPSGIDKDSDGNLYICGYRSHNVFQISANRQRSRIIELQSISRPYSIVVHPQKKELVITSLDEDTVFEAYRLA